MLDQIRRDIQARLEDLLGEIDKLRQALAALTSRESGPDRGDHAAPFDSSSASAGESAARSSRDATARAPRARKASVPPRPTAPAAEPRVVEPQAAEPQAGESPAVGPARRATRAAPGATRHAVLAAFTRGSTMTADEVATATGLAAGCCRSAVTGRRAWADKPARGRVVCPRGADFRAAVDNPALHAEVCPSRHAEARHHPGRRRT